MHSLALPILLNYYSFSTNCHSTYPKVYLYRERVSTPLPSIVYLLYLCLTRSVRVIIIIFLPFFSNTRVSRSIRVYIYTHIHTYSKKGDREEIEKGEESSRERACVSNEERDEDKGEEGMNEAHSHLCDAAGRISSPGAFASTGSARSSSPPSAPRS